MEQELELLRQENEQLKKRLAEEKQRAINLGREAFLADLMGSNRLTKEEFERNCQEFSVRIESDRFLVVGISMEADITTIFGGEAHVDQEGFRYVRFLTRNVVEEMVGKDNICHVLTVQGDSVGLINLLQNAEEGLKSVEVALQQASELFEKHYDTVVTFTVSRVYQGYDALPLAYREICELSQYRIMAGDEARVLVYDMQTEHNLPKSRVEHFDFEHALGGYIRSGDYEAARALVHRMLDAEFNHTRPTVQVYMIRAYGIINDILHVFDSLEEEFSPEFLVELQAGPRIVGANSLQEISREVDTIFDAIIQRQQLEETEPIWLQKAVDYMDENFTDPNLNVSNVADAVGINPVYLSRMLKKYRNIRPLEYIHEKRIAKAKTLLGQGHTVKDTLTKVGYSSALTMNRAFKKFENTTPGAFYREKKN